MSPPFDVEYRAIFQRRESAVRSYSRTYDTVFDTARGSILRSVDGEPYIDFLAGAGALNYGHNDPDLKAALLAHVTADGMAHGLDLHTRVKADFLRAFERLILAPRGLEHRVQFPGPTGANAVEAALKLARKLTGRTNVVAFTNGFHGVSQGALAVTGNAGHRTDHHALLNGVTRMPFDGYLGGDVDTADMLERMLEDPSSGVDPPAAVLLEVIQGEGGLNAASDAWLRRIDAIARHHGAVLIVDDVQAGCGRSSSFFSFESSGVVPGMVVLSKSISGYGLPLALVLISPELDAWRPGEHNGTFRGNQHAFVTAHAALEKFWSDGELMRDVARRAAIVTDSLTQTAARVRGAHVKGRGMMQGVEVSDPELATQVRERCFQQGLLIETAGPHDTVLKVLAPLTTPDAELRAGLTVLDDAVAALAADSELPSLA